jgi:very-short-patch-repair endonuclease
MNIEEYNWKEIQEFYNNNHSLRECNETFKINWCVLWEAKKQKLLITRTNKQSQDLRKIRGTSRLHTDETKQKMSKIRKAYLKEHPEMVPYKLNHYSKRTSYGERYFMEVFEKETIPLKHHLQVGLYELDFYNEELKIYFEVDGDQHYLDKKILESDIRRNKWLFEQGWVGMRLRWSTYQTLSYEQKHIIVNNIRQFLITNNRELAYVQLI